jgi:hypothetical protein
VRGRKSSTEEGSRKIAAISMPQRKEMKSMMGKPRNRRKSAVVIQSARFEENREKKREKSLWPKNFGNG